MYLNSVRKVIKLAILAIILGGCAQVARATTAVLPSDEKMIVESRAIVRARVLSIGSSFDHERGDIFTYTTLRVREVIKGQITTRRIVIKEMGGQVGDQITKVFGVPEFVPGEEVILYLSTWTDGSLRVHEMFLGKYSIVSDSATGQQFVVRSGGGEGVHLIPQVEPGDSTNQMELNKYLDLVRTKLANNRERAEAHEATYFGDIPILARPGEFEGKSASGEIEPQFRLFNPPARWFQPDSGQNVVFFVNTDGAPAGAVTDMEAAMSAWSNVAGSALRVVSGGATTSCTNQFGGPSVIVFNNCDAMWAGSPCQNILALGGWSGTTETRVINGTTFNRITRGFVTFNPFSCEFGNHCNIREIATHELGHALGFHHSWQPSFGGSPTAAQQAATMYYIAHFDGRCAALQQDDRNGVAFVYPGSSPPPTLSIGGRVMLGTGALSGVSFGGSGATCTTSDAGGNYSCTVASGWNGSITASRNGVTFTPASRSYTNVTANQTAQNYAATAADTDIDGIPDFVESTEGTNPNIKDNDVFSNARLFVMQQYRDFLGREGDSGGVTFWAGQINSGARTRAQTVDNFFNSTEFQNNTAPVTRLYFAYFLRVPDTGGLNFWLGQFRSGVSLEAISQAFAQSTEFQSRYGSLTNSQFVSLVYNNVLGRPPDSGGLAFWTGRLDSGAMNRGQVMLAFSESAEYRIIIFNDVFVTQIYVGMLRRAPDTGGFNFWVGQLDSGVSGLNLIQGFLNSTEYRSRFLP
jgi:hypothetical protein